MSRRRFLLVSILALAVTAAVIAIAWWNGSMHVYAVGRPITASPADCPGELVVAVIGDYGQAGQPEADVAALVASWDPDYVLTTGDNNYDAGAAETIDANIGQYYHAYIAPYQGQYGTGAAENRFFPALGNHDWYTEDARPYLDYFTLPGNERYYTVGLGPLRVFVLDSDAQEPDGITADSVQAQWLQAGLADSAAPWNLVVMHHTPYTSSLHRSSDPTLQWPYAAWGAAAVISGHDHLYERLEADGIPYLVNGAGGKSLYPFGPPEPESVVRYNRDYGALVMRATGDCLNISFYSRAHELIDSVTLRR